jgi:hypothetical protein
MKTNPFHQTVIVTGRSGLVFGIARFPLAPVALENDFRVRKVNVGRAMLAQLASGSKCF